MELSDFEFDLPDGAIAQYPATPRDAARLLIHRVGEDATQHRTVRDLALELRAGDLLVVNDTRVLAARVRAGVRVAVRSSCCFSSLSSSQRLRLRRGAPGYP